MRLDDVATPDLVCADTAVVAALRRRIAADGPAVGTTVFEERVLLLDAEPGLVRGEPLGDLDARRPGVRLMRSHIDVEDLAQHELVIAAAYRVGRDQHGVEHTVGTAARGLFRAGTVETPDRRGLSICKDLGLGTQLRRGLLPIYPYVLRPVRHRIHPFVGFIDRGRAAAHLFHPAYSASRRFRPDCRNVNSLFPIRPGLFAGSVVSYHDGLERGGTS